MTFTTLPMLQFLTRLAEGAKALRPEDLADVKEFEELCLQAEELDEKGRVTREASEAKRKLENPQMVSTPMKRAIAAKRKKLLKYQERATKAFTDASLALGLAIQAEAELAIYETAEPLPENRKANGPSESKDTDIQFFLDWCSDRGLPPYIFSRLTNAEREVIARLLLDARDDPYYERVDNIWPLLFQAGLLTTPQAEPTPDQTALLAAACDRYHGSRLELRDDLERRLGRKLDVSEGFASSLEIIARRETELGEVEARLLFCAANEQISEDAEIVGRMLGYDLAGKKRIEAAIQSIKRTASLAPEFNGDTFAEAVVSLVAGIKECDKRQHDIGFWPELVVNGYLKEQSSVTKFVDDPSQFWALFGLALKLSGLDLKYPYRRTVDSSVLDQVEDEVPLTNDGFEWAWEDSSYSAEANAPTSVPCEAEPIPDPLTADLQVYGPTESAKADDLGEVSVTGAEAEVRNACTDIVIWRQAAVSESQDQNAPQRLDRHDQNSEPVHHQTQFRREDFE